MAKSLRLREVRRALVAVGCTVKAHSGSHTKWVCPCGRHTANIPRHSVVSPGVVRSTIERLACLPEGWLK